MKLRTCEELPKPWNFLCDNPAPSGAPESSGWAAHQKDHHVIRGWDVGQPDLQGRGEDWRRSSSREAHVTTLDTGLGGAWGCWVSMSVCGESGPPGPLGRGLPLLCVLSNPAGVPSGALSCVL